MRALIEKEKPPRDRWDIKLIGRRTDRPRIHRPGGGARPVASRPMGGRPRQRRRWPAVGRLRRQPTRQALVADAYALYLGADADDQALPDRAVRDGRCAARPRSTCCVGATDLPDFRLLEAQLKETSRTVRGRSSTACWADRLRRAFRPPPFAGPAEPSRTGMRTETMVPNPLRRADLQRAAVQLCQRAGDRQAEAGAGVALRELVLHLLEGPSELGRAPASECRSHCPRWSASAAPATLRARTEM